MGHEKMGNHLTHHQRSTFVIGSPAFNALGGSLTGLVILILICAFVWLKKQRENKEKKLSIRSHQHRSPVPALYNFTRRLSNLNANEQLRFSPVDNFQNQLTLPLR